MFRRQSLHRTTGATRCSVCLLLLLLSPALSASDCEWCGAPDAPASVPVTTMTIATADEPGERLRISGTVYQRDGKTPAANILLFAYHTNAAGDYPLRGDERGNARRQGYLRGWLRTDADGRYVLHTIRPGAYPGGKVPAHIHLTIQQPGYDEYWIDEIFFADDPQLTPAIRQRQQLRGGSGIVRLSRDERGTLHGVRNIVLMH